MTEQEIRDGVAARHWFHNIHLPYGIKTPGTRDPNAWSMYKLPEKLDGLHVLDIGAWDGGFSYESERRGAASVTAMDLWGNIHGEPGSMGEGWDNFSFAHKALESKVVPVNRNVYDLNPDCGQFDLVLFLEVLYHLQDPMKGLKCVHSVIKPGGKLVLETWMDALSVPVPAMFYYEGDELNKDATNWWGPNKLCVEAMLRTTGFKNIEQVYFRQDCHFEGRGQRACFHAIKP